MVVPARGGGKNDFFGLYKYMEWGYSGVPVSCEMKRTAEDQTSWSCATLWRDKVPKPVATKLNSQTQIPSCISGTLS